MYTDLLAKTRASLSPGGSPRTRGRSLRARPVHGSLVRWYPDLVGPTDAQRKILHLVEVATRAPDTEEGRSAAVLACRMIRHHGLLILRPDEMITFVVAPPPPAPAPIVVETVTKSGRKRRRRADQQESARPFDEIVSSAAGELLSGALRNVFRGR